MHPPPPRHQELGKIYHIVTNSLYKLRRKDQQGQHGTLPSLDDVGTFEVLRQGA